MDNLVIPPSAATPAVDFNAATGVIALSGESYPENAFEFFKPLLAWVSVFFRESTGPATAEIALSYLNTSSIKSVMDLLDLFESAHREGRQVSVRWSYHKDNDRALEMIEEFKEEVTLPFFIVPAGA